MSSEEQQQQQEAAPSSSTTTTTEDELEKIRKQHLASHQRIYQICQKPLESLPVGKDLPRLARKFLLFHKKVDSFDASSNSNNQSITPPSAVPLDDQTHGLQQQYVEFPSSYTGTNMAPAAAAAATTTTDAPATTAAPSAPAASDTTNQAADSDTSQAHVIYHLLKTIHDKLIENQQQQQQQQLALDATPPSVQQNSGNESSGSSSVAAVSSQFPSLSQYEHEINVNDHVSLTEFLLHHFGQEHPLTRLLKACHQTVIINVLFQVREQLMHHQIQFKDVRGQWKIYVYFPTTAEGVIATTPREGGAPSFLPDPYHERVCVTQRRREQVYTKKEPPKPGSTPTPTGPRPVSIQSMFNTLFQIEWEIRIWFDYPSMEIYDISIHLLDIIYDYTIDDKEETRRTQEQQEEDRVKYANEAKLIKEIFHNLNLIDYTSKTQQALKRTSSAIMPTSPPRFVTELAKAHRASQDSATPTSASDSFFKGLIGWGMNLLSLIVRPSAASVSTPASPPHASGTRARSGSALPSEQASVTNSTVPQQPTTSASVSNPPAETSSANFFSKLAEHAAKKQGADKAG